PGFRVELEVGVRGDRAPAVGAGRHDPVGDPRLNRGLADAVAARDCAADGRDGQYAVELARAYFLPEPDQKLALPGIRPVMVLQWAIFAPRIGGEHEAERVSVEAADELRQLRVDLVSGWHPALRRGASVLQ